MFSEFFKLELRQAFKQPMIYIFLLINFLLIFGAATSDQITVGGSTGNIHKNAPVVVMLWLSFMSFFIGLLTTTAFMNGAALRDYQYRFHQILFAAPIRKADYFWGRFWGAYLAAVFPLLGVYLAVGAAPFMPWIDAERYGSFYPHIFTRGMLMFALPNIFFGGAVLYALANWWRNVFASFVGAILLLVGYGVALSLTSDLENEKISMLLDPFAIQTLDKITKYWTPSEKNVLPIPLGGWLLLNRLIWVGAGILVLLISYWRFTFQEKTRASRKRRPEEEAVGAAFFASAKALPAAQSRYGTRAALIQLWNQTRLDFLGVVRSVPFLVILLLGAINMGISLAESNEWYGVNSFPVTYIVVDVIRNTFYLFLVAILMFYSGALVWKERDAHIQDLYDSLPFPTWVNYAAKFLAVVGIVAVIQLFCMVAGITAQTFMGYTQYELRVYVMELMVLDMMAFIFLIAASIFIHTLVNHKYLGYFAFIVFLMANTFGWNLLKVSSNMLIIGGVPAHRYSDMNAWGPYLSGLTWFNAYWAAFFALLLCIGSLFWVRGYMTSFRARWTEARRRFRMPAFRGASVALFGAWAAVGGFVFYNTQHLNQPVVQERIKDIQAEYEKQYKRYEGIPQPRVTAVRYDIDIYPQSRDVLAKAALTIQNKSDQPIDSIHFTLAGDGFTGPTIRIELPNSDKALDDAKRRYQIYKLHKPLMPGDSLNFRVYSEYVSRGFENEVGFTQVVQNGTFFNNTDFMPQIGYQPRGELSQKRDRKKRGLPERERTPALKDPCGPDCNNTYLSNNSDWVQVETFISTSPDQIAVAPGSLKREWEQNERRYFHYVLDHPSWDFYSFISANYEVARERWNDVDMEVYYIKGHEYNVDKMLKSIRKSLEYCSAEFSPYWHKQARIIEFPRYASFAQAFPGAMPYSEGIGFIANLKDPDDIDMVFYVVAHEMGHQWWAHQVCGANVQGATMLSETFSQYAAMMVMEKEYGRDQMKKFLKYEMDRYLRGRGSEAVKETPLMKGENQGYIHYNKGSVVMYAMRDYIGDTAVNAALREFLHEWAFREPPYPTTLDFTPYLRRHTPDSLQYLIKDMFEEITLYNNRCTEASYRALPDGRYEVTLVVIAEKFSADSLGRETSAPLKGDYIDIGVLGEAPKGKKEGPVIYKERHKFRQRENTFTITVHQKPAKAGIDPYLLLVDRAPDDNLKTTALKQ